MKFFIDSNALDRLTNPCLLTRQNALKEVSSIMRNNILVEERSRNPLAAAELSVVNLENLTRQLIRWFHFKPITNEGEIFDLLIMIFSREDFLRHITNSMSIERIKKEMVKISRLLMPQESSEKLDKIDDLLNRYKDGILVDVANETGSFIEQPATPASSEQKEISFIERIQKLMISPKIRTPSKCDDKKEEDDEKKQHKREFWVSLDKTNLETFNFIDSQLMLYNDESRLKNIVKFLCATICDYPAEFFLQPPFVLETLTDVVPKMPTNYALQIFKFVHFIVNGLKERYIDAAKQNLKYMPIKKHMNKVVQMFTNIFETFNDNCLDIKLELMQQRLNAIYLILFDMVSLVENTEDICDIYLNELLNMMAKVVRGFRQIYDSQQSDSELYRYNYIVLIYLINAFVSRINLVDISNKHSNNLWEAESDLALLDYTLQHSHIEVYNLIKRNRSDVIAEDKYFNLVLHVTGTLKPVGDLFQNWKSFTDERIIYKGAKCLDTLRIHKSIELVEVLFHTIEKCAAKFGTNAHLKEVAVEIVLRLLSHDVPEIRLKAYALARNNVQTKMSEDNDEKLKDCDLCVIFGIPITYEVVFEILCFGYTDENEDIYKNAKLILFTLLRSKIVYPNHWPKILEAIRPALPLVPCLFKKDEKLGFFSFDIFHQHLGFERHEMNKAFLRFMYCPHPKAREMAKIKLLENLDIPEFTQERIETVSDNFCLLQEDDISDLLMPDNQFTFDGENYAFLKKIFSNRTIDNKILQTVLLQLSMQMNSLEVCHMAHNDNLWVYFMSNLDMEELNNIVIRKLFVNIFYKWSVAVATFRIYLSNDPSVFQFLIKTLVECQDDPHIKIQTSSLLFLLAYSDFAVLNVKSMSLPKFLQNLLCPFKFNCHWNESPHNLETQLEWLQNELEKTSDNVDVQNITLRYLRYKMAVVWFHFNPTPRFMSSEIIPTDYYNGLHSSTLQLPSKLILNKKDNMFLKDTTVKRITANISQGFENISTIRDLELQISKISCVMMLPSMNNNSFATEMMSHVGKFLGYAGDISDVQKSMLVKAIELYQNQFIPWMSNEAICAMLMRNPFMLVFKNASQIDENVYNQLLLFINAVIKECETRQELSKFIIANFSKIRKFHFPSNLIEKLCDYLFEVAMKDKSWNDDTKVPAVKSTYTLIRNVLRTMPIELDEKYVNVIFRKFIAATKEFLKPKTNKIGILNTYLINQMFATIEALTSLKYNFTVADEHHSILFLWIKENKIVDKTLLWLIIANLTRNKDSFDRFCDGFKSEMNFTIFDMIFERIFSNELKSNHEQKTLALVVGNFLDHSTNISDSKESVNKKQLMKVVMKFIDEKPMCYNTTSFMVKKMVQNKVPEVVKIVKDGNIIERVLDIAVEHFDLITMCHSYDGLKDHVSEIIENISTKRLTDVFIALENPSSMNALRRKKSFIYKKINSNILNVLLLLMSLPGGFEKIKKVFVPQDLITEMTMAVYSGLRTSNSPFDIVFYIKFLTMFLKAYNGNKIVIASSIFGRYEPEIVYSARFNNIPEELGDEMDKPENAFLKAHFKKIVHTCDLFLLQAVTLFDFADSLKQPEASHHMKHTTFVFIRNLLNDSNRARTFAVEINLQEWITNRTQSFINNPINMFTNSYSEAVKKHGVQKCKYVVRNLCVLLKAISEWNLPAINTSAKMKELFEQLKKMYTWIENDKILLNIFYEFIQYITQLDIIKACITQEINGTSLIKGILQKIQKEAHKVPHTDSSLVLIRNGIYTIEKCSRLVDVRIVLKNAKIFQLLDLLQPQILSNKKSTWNEIAEMWLDFFQVLTRYEDCECSPGQISLLCRIVRIGNQSMKSSALKIIRNLSMNSTLGNVVLVSDDFMQTADLILSDDGNKDDKLLILQTLLSIASKSEQSRSKLKNSSFNRKLKEHLVALEFVLQNTTDSRMASLYYSTSMLKEILYA